MNSMLAELLWSRVRAEYWSSTSSPHLIHTFASRTTHLLSVTLIRNQRGVLKVTPCPSRFPSYPLPHEDAEWITGRENVSVICPARMASGKLVQLMNVAWIAGGETANFDPSRYESSVGNMNVWFVTCESHLRKMHAWFVSYEWHSVI